MTAIEKYINELTKAKQLAVDRFGNLTTIEKRVIDGSYDWLLTNLTFKRGTVVVDEDFTNQMNDFVNAVVDILNNDKGYQNKVEDFLQDMRIISKNIAEFQANINGFDIEKAGLKPLQKTMIDNIIDQYTENGLNAHFAQPLKDGIFRNALAGMNQSDARNYLVDYIGSGKDQSGKLYRYIEQTSIQAVDSYTGAINQKIRSTFDTTGFIIDGSIIDTSSPQCVKMVELAKTQGGYVSDEQMEEIIAYAKTLKNDGGLIEGTDLDNLPINKLHRGCRHNFSPTIKKQNAA